MINETNISKSEILTDPWPHKIVDNVLDEHSFKNLLRVAERIKQIEEFHTKEILWMDDILKLTDAEVVDDIVYNANKILDVMPDISKGFTEKITSNLGYFNNPRIGISMANSVGEIHDEGTNKVMAFIIYISPENSTGTLLYKENNRKTFSKEIEWKPNRGFLMYSVPGKTWHSFSSKDDEIRITLNFYYEKLEALHHVNKNFPKESLLWLHNELGKGNLIKYD